MHAVVAVLAVLRSRRPDDMARDAVTQLIPHIFWDGVRQPGRRSPRDDPYPDGGGGGGGREEVKGCE